MIVSKAHIKNAIVICLFALLAGCSTAALDQISNKLSNINTPSSSGSQPTKGPKESCSINIKSDVDGVNVVLEEKNNWTRKDQITWVTNGTYKKIEVSCTDHIVDLYKECYENKKFNINFNTEKTVDIYVNRNEWLKYAYLRTEYISGDVPFISIKGMSPQVLEIKKNENYVKQVEVGKYAIDISAHNKITKKHDISVCSENDIYILNVEVLPPGEIIAHNGVDIKIHHGVGRMRVVNDRSNVYFIIHNLSSGKSFKFKPPIILDVPYGEYRIEYGNKKSAIKVDSESPEEILIDLSAM